MAKLQHHILRPLQRRATPLTVNLAQHLAAKRLGGGSKSWAAGYRPSIRRWKAPFNVGPRMSENLLTCPKMRYSLISPPVTQKLQISSIDDNCGRGKNKELSMIPLLLGQVGPIYVTGLAEVLFVVHVEAHASSSQFGLESRLRSREHAS
jgi:hypothetical protein